MYPICQRSRGLFQVPNCPRKESLRWCVMQFKANSNLCQIGPQGGVEEEAFNSHILRLRWAIIEAKQMWPNAGLRLNEEKKCQSQRGKERERRKNLEIVSVPTLETRVSPTTLVTFFIPCIIHGLLIRFISLLYTCLISTDVGSGPKNQQASAISSINTIMKGNQKLLLHTIACNHGSPRAPKEVSLCLTATGYCHTQRATAQMSGNKTQIRWSFARSSAKLEEIESERGGRGALSSKKENILASCSLVGTEVCSFRS